MEYEEDVYVEILDESPVDKGKGNADSGEFDRWDGGGSVSGGDESDQFYSHYRNEDGHCRESFKVRSVVEKRKEAENEGGNLSSRCQREAKSVEEMEEEKFSEKHVEFGSGDKVHKRNYRQRNVVDHGLSDEDDGDQFTRKVKMHGYEDKEHERKYRHRKVVDDDYSDEEAKEEKLFAGKHIMRGSVDKERVKNYRRRSVADDAYSDGKAKKEQFTRKVSINGSEDKDHKRIRRRRRVIDDDYSEDEKEECQITSTSKLIIQASEDKQHRQHCKRRRMACDDYSDEDFEFDANRSKELDDYPSDDGHTGKIMSRRRSHSRSRDEKMSKDHLERDRRRHRDDSHERKKDHQRYKHMKHDGYGNEETYKRVLKEKHHSTRYISEDDDIVDDLETEILENKRENDYKMEKIAKEENFDSRQDTHRSARYQSEHDDEYDCEMRIMEGERDYVFTKEHRNDAKEDKCNRRPRGSHHSTIDQTEHVDNDWRRDTMERERRSWEQGRGKNDNSNEMKHMKREKYQDFRGHDKDNLRGTSMIERRKEEEDVRVQGGDFLENLEVNRHVKHRLGSRETSDVRRDLRIQISEAKEMSRQRELTDVENERDSKEQRSLSLDVRLQRESEERPKDRGYRRRDRECMSKSKEIKQNKEDEEECWKLSFSESRGNNYEKEKIHKVIRKKDLTERDITSMEDNHRRKWSRKMGKIISVRNFSENDSRKQDMEDLLHVVKESDSDEYNIRNREMSQETEWDRKRRQNYQRTEYMSRENQGREGRGRQNMSERGGVLCRNDKLLETKDDEKKDEFKDRGFNKRRETARRDYVERSIWKPDIEIRERNLKMEEMHKNNKNERGLTTGDVMRETSHQKEYLNKAEEKSLRESDKMSHQKTLVNDFVDNENRIGLMTRDTDMENSQQKEFLNKEKDKSRREGVKRSLYNTLEDKSIDKENDRNSVVRESVCWEESKQTMEGENVRELLEEEEKCRKHCKESPVDLEKTYLGTESERHQKTIFAYQISTKANDRDVYWFFSQAGKVLDVRLVMDPILGRFIGVGYVEFYHSNSIPVAVSLSGKLLHGQPVMVKPPEADDSLVNSTTNAARSDISGPCPGRSNRLCVGNLHDSVTEAQLHQVFEAFGTIELLQFNSAETGHCEHKCTIQFARLADACAALSLNGHLALAGQLIEVYPVFVSDRDEVQVLSADTNGCKEALGKDILSDSDIGVQNELQIVGSDSNGCHEAIVVDLVPESNIGFPNEVQKVGDHMNCCNEADGTAVVSDIGVQNVMQGSDSRTIVSSEEKGTEMVSDGLPESAFQTLEPCGVELNKRSSPVNDESVNFPSESLEHLEPPRLPSIQSFVNSLKSVLQVPGAVIPIVDTVGVPSDCLHLKNMFDLNMQASEEFESRVKEDVEEHCYKFGKPKEIHIEKNSAGCVYLRFKNTQTAIVAQRGLHGRWFAGKMITATYMKPRTYDAKFPNIEQASVQEQPSPACLPHNYGPSFPISGQTLGQGPTPSLWLAQTYGSNFPVSQQPLLTAPTPAMWVPNNNNNNNVAFGAGFGNGGQFMQPPVQGSTFPYMRPNVR